MIDTAIIVRLCGLNSVAEDTNGWRAETPYEPSPDPKKSLSIGKAGVWKCHRSGKTGHVIELYAHMIGKPVSVARAALIKEGHLPRGFEIVPVKTDLDVKQKHADMGAIIEKMATEGTWIQTCAQWRGIPPEIITGAAHLAAMGHVDAYAGMGSAYAFVSTSPGMDGARSETKAVHLRSSIPENKQWKSIGAYPIWVPEWNINARDVYLVEGQWDALALHALIQLHGDGDMKLRAQVMALCQGKNIGAREFPEILVWFNNKTVIQIPDADEAGEKILIGTHAALEQTEAKHRLLRILPGRGKDVNEMLQKGISSEDFQMWIASLDDFRVSNGVVMDAAYREKHRIRLDSLVEIGADGEPVEVMRGKVKPDEPVDREHLLRVIKPFPMLSRYVEECLQVNEAPAIWHVMTFLTYFSAILGRRVKFESGSGGILYPTIYTMLVGDSGLGKSQAMYMLKGPAGDSDKTLFTSDNFSPEALFDEIAEHPQKMMVFDEFSEWMPKSETSYKYQSLKAFIKLYDAHHYNEAHPYKQSFRQKNRTVEIPNPSLAVLAACTPSQLMDVDEDMLRGGIIGRFMFAIGRDFNSRIPIPGRITHDLRLQIRMFYLSVLKTPPREDAMVFSEKAALLFDKAFKNQIKYEEKLDLHGDMRTYSSRWRVQVFKFAMLFELQNPDLKWPLETHAIAISEKSLIAALRMVRMLHVCFIQLFKGQFKMEATSKDGRIRERIVKYVRDHMPEDGSGVGRTDIFKFIQEKASVLEDNLSAMVSGGVLLEKNLKGRGRPKTVYLLTKPKEEVSYAHLDLEAADVK